ncbi:MAG: OmpH family outer membrane protein [Bacteroidales bacterium]|nr:OmpH family outer membrane protein [Bacteroidales bacterium]
MIKRLLLAILIALPFSGFAQAKFGIINTQTLMEEMPEMNDVKTQLETASKKYEDEYQNLGEQFTKAYQDLQNLDESTPQAIKERRAQELQDLNTRIEQFRNTATQDLQRQQEQLMAPIQQKVMTAITAVGDEGGFTMIFENMVPIYTGKDVVDVTPLVKAKLGLK